jgi:hypothetical protein
MLRRRAWQSNVRVATKSSLSSYQNLKASDPTQNVKYEGDYEQALDLCYVEVSKPGKSPYPMQEPQDLVNHSPTGTLGLTAARAQPSVHLGF